MKENHFYCVVCKSGALISISLLFLALASVLLISCTIPATGQGPPPGYIGGDIPEAYKGLRNPFSLDDREALDAGRRLYFSFELSCAVCHGSNGRGDGPKAPYLEPEPADFAAPLMLKAFREHQDYVFWWVSEGVPQTGMPAWKDLMSETERWQVITYAWHLGEPGASRTTTGRGNQSLDLRQPRFYGKVPTSSRGK